MLNYTSRWGTLFSSKASGRSASHRPGRRSRNLRFEALDPRLLLTADPIVTFNTSMGSFQVELFADAAPQTVANFLSYVNSGAYSNTFIHRVVDQTGFQIVQGGGYSASSAPFFGNTSTIPHISTSPAIPLEYNQANAIGTIAMARTSDLNSATSEFFFNVSDNTTNLGQSNGGGYAVFGKILGNGLSIVSAMNAIQTLSDLTQGAYDQSILGPIPLVNFDIQHDTEIDAKNLIIVNSVTLAAATFSGTVFIDQDGNGQINGPDAGKSGFTVFIDSNDDGQLSAGEASTVTDANGNYSFSVAPGNYVVRIVPQAGWVQTSPVAATPAFGAQRFTLTSNQTLANQNFGLSVVLSTPDTPVLPTALDSGASNSDGKTNLKSLQFVVTGVQAGATVTLRDGQNVIGSALAQGTSVTITPSADFTDGTHSITATQSMFGQTSSASAVRTIVVKTTAPIISSTPPATAVVGALYSYSVVTSSDVTGLSLLNPLAGMVAPTLATPLTWTPTASQVGPQSTTLVATDVFGNTAQQQISIAVNGPPFFPAIPDQKVNQGSLLSLTPTATDLDPLTWSLGDGAPDGAAINPTTGLFTWQPTAAIAAGTYSITINVQDPGGLTASQVMHVTVNAPPVVGVIDPKSVDEGSTLSFQIPASDQDALAYQLIGTPPAGAAVSAAGQFTWQPTKAQVGSDYTFTVRVTDTGGLSVDRTFSVTAVKLSGTFSGTVFIDQDGNGQINGADSGLPDFTVYIDANDNGQLDAGEASTVTDANGNYSFEGLPGNYVVRIVPQVGWAQSSPLATSPAFGAQRFTLAPNGTVTGENFGMSIVLNAPNTPVLPSAFDSGLFNNDGNTNLSALQFVVSGVHNGATVTLYDNGHVIGSGVEQSNSVTITPAGAFADGTHLITATQTLEGKTSDASQARSVVVKTTPPAITSTPPATAEVGNSYAYNVTVSDDVAALSLANPLAGMVAPTLSSPLLWTPTVGQIGAQSVTLIATDVFGNTAQQVISVKVNAPPAFPPIPDKLVNQGSQLSFTPAVTDEDPLTYSLEAGAPDGAAIDSTTGLFTWTPTTATPPGSYHITITAVDPGGLAASQTVRIVVNAPPTLGVIDPQTVDEGKTLSFQIPATDQDSLIYQLLDSPPDGASINSAGLFTWTPTEAQGGAIYTFTVRVTDTGGFTAEQTFTVTVNKVDSPPSISPIGTINIVRGQTVGFVANGTDADLPFSGITYSLDPGAPDGASIDPVSGAFTWQVPSNYPLGTTTITVRVTDNTESALSASTTVKIVVGAVPPTSTGGDSSGGVGVDDNTLQTLASNPGIAAMLVGPFNALGGLPTIPTGPAVLQQLAKVAVDRAVVGLDEAGDRFTGGAFDFFRAYDNGIPHDGEQWEKDHAGAGAGTGEEGSGGSRQEGEQPTGDEPKATTVQPLEVTNVSGDQTPPPRSRVRGAHAAANDADGHLNQRGPAKIKVAPQAKAWPTAQSFKAQLKKAEVLKEQAVKAQPVAQSIAPTATPPQETGRNATDARDDQTGDRSNDRNRAKRASLATAAMVPLLIGQIEARDKLAERNRKRQARGR